MENEQQAPKPTLPLLALLALASALGVAVAVALAGVAMLLAAPAYAGDGSLLLQRPAALAEAPLLFAEAETQEDGPIVRTRIVEAFHNPFAERLQAIYLRNLPGNARVERFRVAVLTGEEEEPAEEAPAQGTDLRPAVLAFAEHAVLEQATEVGPGETVLVELEYQQLTRYGSPRGGLRLLSSR